MRTRVKNLPEGVKKAFGKEKGVRIKIVAPKKKKAKNK